MKAPFYHPMQKQVKHQQQPVQQQAAALPSPLSLSLIPLTNTNTRRFIIETSSVLLAFV